MQEIRLLNHSPPIVPSNLLLELYHITFRVVLQDSIFVKYEFSIIFYKNVF